jgi:DNA-binding transcriptional LysR family regulator
MNNAAIHDIVMNSLHSAALDLNLLKVFDAVMQTRSVSRAAEVLGVGQSAVSHSLARLREATGDPLFIRSAGRMEPTPRAQRLAEPMRDALLMAVRALAPEAAGPFDPARSRTMFRIAAGDYAATIVLRGLAGEIAEAGWDMALSVRPLDRHTAPAMLDSGEVDLAIGLFPKVQPWQDRHVLFDEGHACLFDGERLGLRAPLSLADYVAQPHILPSLHGELSSFVDAALEAAGGQRRRVMATPHFLSIPLLLKTVPAIATLPARLAVACANAAALTTSPLPFESPRFEVSMAWHRRDTASPPHRWLRERIVALNRPRAPAA